MVYCLSCQSVSQGVRTHGRVWGCSTQRIAASSLAKAKKKLFIRETCQMSSGWHLCPWALCTHGRTNTEEAMSISGCVLYVYIGPVCVMSPRDNMLYSEVMNWVRIQYIYGDKGTEFIRHYAWTSAMIYVPRCGMLNLGWQLSNNLTDIVTG